MNFRLARAYNLNVNLIISNASAVEAEKNPHIRWRESLVGKSLPTEIANLPSPNATHNLESRPGGYHL